MDKCVACGNSKFFLRRKGSAIGLYCSSCLKWVKWVGKKDVKILESRGFKVYSEGYTPKSSGISNLHPSFGVEESKQQPTQDLPPFFENEGKTQSQTQSSIPCLVCETGYIKSLSDSDRISANLVETTLVIKDSLSGIYLGSFEMNYCPKCGNKVN